MFYQDSDRLNGVVGMCPEGVAGVFKGANRSREQIYLGPRKGFIKVAIVAGVGMLLASAFILLLYATHCTLYLYLSHFFSTTT